jgi:tetratricopeptide (TPR) repeat protein
LQPKSSRRVGHVLPPLERAEPPLDSRPVVMINTAASRIAALRRSGLKFWEEGRLEEAAECLAAAAAAAPRDATILAELGSLFRMIGKNAEAMGCFTAALTINPEHLPVWLNAASLAKETGDVGAAEAAFRQALQIDPSCATAAAGLGLLCHEQNRRGEAIKYRLFAGFCGRIRRRIQKDGLIKQDLFVI